MTGDVQWWVRAACYKSFDWRFHGTDKERGDVRAEYCAVCPVQTECAKDKVKERDARGAWAGTRRR